MAQVFDYGFEFGDGGSGEFLRFGEVVGVLDGVVFEPGEVELVVALPDLADVELAETAGGAKVLAAAAAVGVEAVALLEFCEVRGGQRPVFFGDAGDVRACVVDPHVLGGRPFLEEDDVRLDALAVGGKGAAREAEDGVEVAVGGQNLDNLAGFVLEQAVVGQNHRGAAAAFQDSHHLLDEIQLLVAGVDGEVVAVRRLVGALGAERRVGKDAVVALAPVGFVDGVAEINGRLQAMEEQVHQREPARARDEVLAVVGLLPDPLDILAVERAFALLQQPFVGADEEAAGAAGGVADGKVRRAARVGFHYPNDALYQDARSEVLTRPLLPLTGRPLQQPFERGPLHIDIERGPVFEVDHFDDAFQIDGVVEARHGRGEDRAEHARRFAEFAQNFGVVVGQVGTRTCLQGRPRARLRYGHFLFLGHLEEKEECQLLDIVAIINPVVAQDVAEAPEFIDQVGHSHRLNLRK